MLYFIILGDNVICNINIKKILNNYLGHQKDVITRSYRYLGDPLSILHDI